MKDVVQWTAPSPLWAGITGSTETFVREAMLQPAILRFATDSFMEDYMNLMVTDPARLSDFLAVPETWRGPLSELKPVENVPPFLLKKGGLRFLPTRTKQELMQLSAGPLKASLNGQSTIGQAGAEPSFLKLYQPAHQRFYMVAGCLVCRATGLPDHIVAVNRQERVTFVVRRLRERPDGSNTAATGGSAAPTDSLTLRQTAKVYDEYAFITTPGNKGWQKVVGVGAQLVKDEEQLPLSPTNFADTDQRQRRLFTGLIPVSKREAYMGAGISVPPDRANGSPASNILPKTARKILFRTQVSEPWKRIVDRATAMKKAAVQSGSPAPTVERIRDQLREAREQLQVSSWYVLLDLAKFLNEHVNDVWKVVLNPALESTLTNNAQRNLLAALKNTSADATLINALKSVAPDPIIYSAQSVKSNLQEALKAIKNPQDDWEGRLDNVKTPYIRNNAVLAGAWPPFLFPLADPAVSAPQVPNSVPPLGTGDQVEADAQIDDPSSDDEQLAAHAAIDRLTALVVRAMPTNSTKLVPAPPLASQKLMETGEGLFVIRFIYERPLCGPLEPPEVSKPTTPFQLAGYFDPDAPARPIRIALPLDTSPAGLRKFDKNTAFAISDVLCGQIQRMRGMSLGDLVLSVLPWPFHKDLSVPDAGACKTGGLEIGMICSLSIPIITICALLLLMIIVSLLDIIFRWMPYFFICFPIPGLKAKK